MQTNQRIFDRLTTTENLFEAWFAFRRGKANRSDVIEFSRHAERDIFSLRRRLLTGTYQHGTYRTFLVRDPKVRTIRKATVIDRIVHQAIYQELTALYDARFLAHVYSGRAGKGTHAGVSAVERMTWKVSKNYTRPCYYLKCDIKKFYDSIDHAILLKLLRVVIDDERMLQLLAKVVDSFHVEGSLGKGLPIGNVTSQIFTNIYLRMFDVSLSQNVGGGRYARFADDFVIVSHDHTLLTSIRERAETFLWENLRLTLHPAKVTLASLHHGLDFLGYVILPHCRRVRSNTMRRIFRKLSRTVNRCHSGRVSPDHLEQSVQSYLGVLSHANTYRTSCILQSQSFVRRPEAQ